jgi:hypothetical protein
MKSVKGREMVPVPPPQSLPRGKQQGRLNRIGLEPNSPSSYFTRGRRPKLTYSVCLTLKMHMPMSQFYRGGGIEPQLNPFTAKGVAVHNMD